MRAQTLCLGAALLLSACTVGPDYQRPMLPLPERFTEAPAQAGAAVDARWWQLLGSDKLDQLVTRALAQNPGIEASQAALRAAQASVRAQEGAYYPQLSAGYNLQRQKVPAVLASPVSSSAYVYNLHTLNLDVAYTPDLFGLNRRTVESLQAQANSQAYALAATRITLAANVVVAAATEAGLRDQIRLTQDQLTLQRQLLDTLTRLKGRGAYAEADIAAQQLQVASLEATLPPLRKQLDQQRDALKNLLGAYPAEVLGSDFMLADFALPAELPLTLPSALLEQRPDIRVAEENLHAASAAIGVAAANRLPQITLGGTLIGQTAAQLADLFRSAANFWSLAGGNAAPVFDGGTLAAREQVARANYDQAAALYRQTVLAAFQSVADALYAVQHDAQAAQSQATALAAARRALAIAEAQWRLGDLSEIAVLPLRQSVMQAELALAQTRSTQLADVAALCLALGGGWTAK